MADIPQAVAERPGFDPTPPDDVQVDFFGIGAPKSRTTWLARCVTEHPDVCVTIPKETNFFARRTTMFDPGTPARFLCGWDWYRHCFNHARPGQVRGDFSINLYRNTPEAPELLAHAFPEAKLVAVFRDPVKRLYSHYWHRVTNPKAPPLEATPEEALLDEQWLDTSRYHKHLREWERHFPREQLLVLLDLDLQDPLAGVQSVYRHIGVRDTFEPPSLERIVQPIIRQRRAQPGAARVATLLRRAGAGRMVDLANRSGIKQWLWEGQGRDARYPGLDPALAAQVYERLAPDIDALETWLDRDLSAWRIYA